MDSNAITLTPEQEARIAKTREALADVVARVEAQKALERAEAAESVIVPRTAIEREESVCGTCGVRFMATVGVMGKFRIVQMHCEPCCEAERRERNPSPQDIHQRREQAWEALCPPEYRFTDEARVRFEIGNARVDEILAWTHDRGLGIVGTTGRCKTRLMFMLLRKFHMSGKTIRYVNGATLADELADAYGGKNDAEAFMRGIERAPLLFIDDLGKGKLTERLDVFHYRLTEYRSANNLPIYFTSNMTGKALEESWNSTARAGSFWADRAGPTVRRLKHKSGSIAL